MPVWDDPTLSTSPERKPAAMLTVASVKVGDSGSLMVSPGSSVTAGAPAT